MTKKNNNMLNTTSNASRAVYRTGVFDLHKNELVIAVGYTVDGEFGYFIIKEGKAPDGSFCYGDQTLFVKKENERTYQQVLIELQLRLAPEIKQ